MRLPTTLALLAIVGGLMFVIFRYEQTLPNSKERLAALSRPLQFDAAAADAIEITAKDLNVRLERDNNRWRVTAPFEDRASPKLVKQLLTQLSEIEWLQTIHRDELKNGDSKRVGLTDGTAAEVTVRSGKQLIAQCKFGGPGALEGTVHASTALKDHSAVIHLVKDDLASLLRRPAGDWRDSKLLDMNAESIRRFSISASTGTLQFVREAKQPWMLVKPLQTRAANERVNAVLSAFLNLEVKAQSATHAPILSASSNSQLMKITIESEEMPAPVEITLQPPASPDAEPAVSVSDRSGQFVVPPKIADIWKLQLNTLREQRLARIPKDAVSEVHIRSAAFPEVDIRKQGEAWMLKRRGVEEPANEERLQRLFQGLNDVQIEEFTADAPTTLASYGLEKPFLEVEVKAGTKTRILKFGQGETEGIFAMYADEPFVYRIASHVFAVIPPDSVKWRGLAALDLSIFSVHRIVISEGARPPVILDYDPNLASWKGEIAGKDITAMIVRQLADGLLNKVCKLPVVDWTSERSEAYAALQKPTVTIQLLVADPRDADAERKALTMAFAPTAAGMDTAFYHGRINNDPDTFLVSRDTFRQLTAPVVK